MERDGGHENGGYGGQRAEGHQSTSSEETRRGDILWITPMAAAAAFAPQPSLAMSHHCTQRQHPGHMVLALRGHLSVAGYNRWCLASLLQHNRCTHRPQYPGGQELLAITIIHIVLDASFVLCPCSH